MSATASNREEIWNAITHGVGCLAALAAMPVLLVLAAERGDTTTLVGCLIFGLSMVLALAASTAYHANRDPDRRHRLRILDHASIYVLIAGSYTPICLTGLRGPWGDGLLIAVWSMALVGVLLKIRFTGRFELLSTVIYLLMGWICVVAAVPMFERLGSASLISLLAAGVAFTAGVAFYLQDHRRGFHVIWHVFVVTGCAGLYAAVFAEVGRLGSMN
ncbi:MAG: hemolysin III family protein [Phycisphaeraceae bacterium]|nr:hemolysin III family protein [Phycisphaeraceae bacterium]